ncbi:MAG: alpha/beta hydrolase [Pyrinomonadaceae bacterium]
MSRRRRTGRKILKALLPITMLFVLALVCLAGWLAYSATHPPQRAYLVTPDKFVMLSNRGLKVTEESWQNRDGTRARGWLLRGAEGAPAVVMLHRYAADRSWLLNLGVKINEAANFTVLWPDLRGHGQSPPVASSSLGTREAEDVLAALDYLRTLKSPQNRPLVVAARVGLYGVELGAYAALVAATRDAGARALVLDSVPASPDDLLRATVRRHTGFENDLVQLLARAASRVYFMGDYENLRACAAASSLSDRRVLLLAGTDADHLRDSTTALAACFPTPSDVELKNDLPLTGFTLASATGQQGEAYDRRVIEFFDRTLQTAP